jgi:hypothetical protein
MNVHSLLLSYQVPETEVACVTFGDFRALTLMNGATSVGVAARKPGGAQTT